MLFHAVNISEGTTEAGCEKQCHLRKRKWTKCFSFSVIVTVHVLKY